MRAIILAAAALSLTACATPQQQTIMTWSPTGSAAIPEQQALAECRYDGEVGGLSGHGQTMFAMCMRARGYAPGGRVPYAAGQPS